MTDASDRMTKRARVNPYSARLYEFPRRIILFDDREHDTLRVREKVAQAERVVCELGSGSGSHLTELAARNPEAQIFGFELRYKRAVRTIERAQRIGLENATVLRTNSFDLGQIFPNQSIHELHINFPDPWERRRSHKHRMLSARMLETLQVVMAEGALLSIKTDHSENFEQFLELVQSSAAFELNFHTRDLHQSPYLARNIVTEFEALFLSQKLPIFALQANFSRAFGAPGSLLE